MRKRTDRIRIVLLALALALLFSACGGTAALPEAADPPPTGGQVLTESEPPAPAESEPPAPAESEPPAESFPPVPEEPPFDVVSPCAGLYYAATMEPVFEKNAEVPTAPASLTKLAAIATALHYLPKETVFTVGSEQELVHPGSSMCWILPGHRLKIETLIAGMLLPSGNDAAYTLAVNVARSVSGDKGMGDQAAVEYFCGLVNDYVAELGAENSRFLTAEGWDAEGQYTTVRDIAAIGAHLMGSDWIRDIVSRPSKFVRFVSGEHITWYNTNKLIYPDGQFYSPCVLGLKTGTTTAAGACLVAAIEKDGVQYMAVVMGGTDNDQRFRDILKLMELIPALEAGLEPDLPRER